MYRRAYFYMVICLSFLFSFDAGALEEKTLGEIRKELLGKEVIITGVKAPKLDIFQGIEVFLHWYLAERDSQQGFKKKKGTYGNLEAPYRLKGASGIVESIELAESFSQKRKRGTSTDVFGDTVKDDDTLNPYFDIVVKLQEGTLLITTGYYTTIMGEELELASNVDANKDEIQRNIDSLTGKIIFPVAYSKIFPPEADIKDITNTLSSSLNKLRDIPNLTPLKILKAKYLENENGVLLKVEFLGDKTGIIFSRFQNDMSGQKLLFLEKATSGFLTEIPKSLTAKEVKAIKEGAIFKGMSWLALYYSWGFPKNKNDWGTGGEQFIYGDNLFVYVKSGKVVDWQSLSR
jgi:hypothetical protein